MDVLALLRSKNRCLEKFRDLSRDFLVDCARKEDFTLIQQFQNRRDSTLKAMELYDRKITEAVKFILDHERTPELVEAVKSALARKDHFVQEILGLDLEIISRIEEAKNGLLREFASSRKSKESLSKFKSKWMTPSGEEIDRKL